MIDKPPTNDAILSGPARPEAPPPHGPRRRWPWLLAAALLAAAGGALLLSWWGGVFSRPGEVPLDGELMVTVRPAADANASRRVEEPGALPVRAGDWMYLEAQFNQPACAYLVWLDGHGRAVPLYPWNNDRLEVTDLNQPPPARRPTKQVTSPTLGTAWKVGERGGLETVLLLARRTPLEEGAQLGALLGTPPAARMRHREEVAVLGLDRGAGAFSNLRTAHRGSEAEARAADQPLGEMLARLRDRFELIRAVRFAHDGG